jgi:methylenetetrahydrofolate dehydrogenase (NADP+)/methenyltetrahydrofolate cyclohydrolase
VVGKLNADERVDGILVQLPLPSGIDPRRVIAAIDPTKDVDGFHPVNVGRLWSGQPGLVPCTPQGILLLLRAAKAQLAGAQAVVLGRSPIVGRPVAALLLAADCTVTMVHSKSRGLPAICRRADIVVAALGRPRMVKGDWLKPGATVIDVGINRITTPGGVQLVGDVDFAAARRVAGAITPVPGGVGPMTIACLLRNTLLAACRRRGLPDPEALSADVIKV